MPGAGFGPASPSRADRTIVRPGITESYAGHVMILYPKLTPLQQKAFDLLGVNRTRTQ